METTQSTVCNTATLAPYVPTSQNPWNLSKVFHTYRRLGFSCTIAEADTALALGPDAFIDSMVDTAVTMPPTTAPSWGYWAVNDFNDFEVENPQFMEDWLLQTGNDLITENLRGRLVAFWMNHFVTQLQTYQYAPYLFQYYRDLQVHALGNFKDFVHAIGRNNAMLLYLNGFENTAGSPNENYARELFELFTLGEGNGYTENDITETSRALTGFNHWTEPGAAIYFDVSTHDTGSKTIFGQTGAWGYDDVIDLLFNERGQAVCEFICAKLYRYFVNETIDALVMQDIIEPMAQTMIANNYELAPVLRELFKSEHFFDENVPGVIVKSPIDIIFGFVKEAEFYYDDIIIGAFINYAGIMGQRLYDPPDVAGWQRDEDWINTSTLTGRWQLMELYMNYLFTEGYELDFTDLAKDLTNNSNDPEYITQVMVDHFLPKGFHTASDYDIATNVLKWDVPQNYYDDGIWNLDWSTAPLQVMLLLVHLTRMPEFQLK